MDEVEAAEGEVGIDAWVAAEKARLDRFAAWYRKEAAAALEDQDWPMARYPGDWADDALMFRG